VCCSVLQCDAVRVYCSVLQCVVEACTSVTVAVCVLLDTHDSCHAWKRVVSHVLCADKSVSHISMSHDVHTDKQSHSEGHDSIDYA